MGILFVRPAHAANYSMFLHVDGISGEATAAGEAGNIELVGFGWGIDTAAGNRGAPHELTATHIIDKASTQLMTSGVAHNKVNAELHVHTTLGPQTIMLKVRFLDAHIIAVHQTGSAEGAAANARPTETFSIRYEKVEVTYQPLGADGRPNGPATTFNDDFR
jgi:type VI secretion system Hcp family effector